MRPLTTRIILARVEIEEINAQYKTLHVRLDAIPENHKAKLDWYDTQKAACEAKLARMPRNTIIQDLKYKTVESYIQDLERKRSKVLDTNTSLAKNLFQKLERLGVRLAEAISNLGKLESEWKKIYGENEPLPGGESPLPA